MAAWQGKARCEEPCRRQSHPYKQGAILLTRPRYMYDADGRDVDMNAIFEHATSGAKCYVGNISAAQNKRLLLEHGITRVVNCQGTRSRSPDDSGQSPRQQWQQRGSRRTTPQPARRSPDHACRRVACDDADS